MTALQTFALLQLPFLFLAWLIVLRLLLMDIMGCHVLSIGEAVKQSQTSGLYWILREFGISSVIVVKSVVVADVRIQKRGYWV